MSPDAPIRVLLADDHRLLRAGIRALLSGLPGIEVVAEAENGIEALELIRLHRPDVVLMDIGMKEMNGIEATERAARKFPRSRVIILSMQTAEEYVARALHAGAAGYLVKDAAPSEVEVAVRAVASGATYLSPGVSRHVVEGYMRRTSGGEGPSDDVALTPRQREILQLVAEGRTTKEIAQRLGLSPKTVESHRGELNSRLGVHDIAGLVRYAVKRGLVDPDR